MPTSSGHLTFAMLSAVMFGAAAAFAPSPALRAGVLMRPAARPALTPSMLEIAPPILRAAKFLKGDGVSAERVPCGDNENEECYALCDTDGCSTVGTVGASELGLKSSSKPELSWIWRVAERESCRNER